MKRCLYILCFLAYGFTFAQYALPSNQLSNKFSFASTEANNYLISSSSSHFITNNDFVNQFQDGVIASNTYDFLLNKPNYSLIYQDVTHIKDKWYKTDTGASLIAAGGLIAAGTIMHFNYDFKVSVKEDINRYLPDFHSPIDDLTQYLPYIGVFALDAAGIRSKHSTLRKASTIGTAIAINLVVVQGMKYGIAELRPDGSSNNSFPSGHTATAFMGAHIFHKEYKHRSPFYSIAAYTLATFTGVMRQLNDRHWISDVFAGAGIGIGTTELAYFLNDGWWKENGINEIEETNRIINESKPSFLGVKVGYASLIEETDVLGLSSQDGYRISTEGAYFITKNIGIGGEIGFQSFPISIDESLQQSFNAEGFELLPEASGNMMYYGGAYYQIPFGKNSIGVKLLTGVISGPSTKLYVQELTSTNEASEEEPLEQFVYADFDPKTSFSWASGIYYKRVLNKNLSVGLYADYNIGDLKYNVVEMDDFNNGAPTYLPQEAHKVNYDSYAFGVNVDVMLW
ncbi:phosphatase PAP2 family protein [Tamlana agarivorans]|uniref:Phosphatase PAP2 family protein n=1 Tax=Pseudotamlana agarivorans TaxID=481183 RepID=A0ACC5U7K2_9FLAO|nr:phosphatase PAP2 family protein [Tamlana agarivorans]MBU2950224.1 phosphatase PAP2 family protein [Tamlana agarivorans]